jgi:hypothetical protein
VEAVFVALIPESNEIILSKIDAQIDANPQLISIHSASFKGAAARTSPVDPFSEAFIKALLERASKEITARRAALNKTLANDVYFYFSFPARIMIDFRSADYRQSL